jgi:outer membrane receptor protein involved in Fe transport
VAKLDAALASKVQLTSSTSYSQVIGARGRAYIAVGLFACCVSAPALAQVPLAQPSTSAHPDDVYESGEIIVTAQRRQESLQRVPISIAVLGGGALDQSPSNSVSDALRTIPGVSTLQSYQGGGTLVTVRGVTAGNALFNGSGTVGYYLDSVPFGAVKSAIAPDSSAYDLERVEVLRGPQGTLYGANALNGVVRVLTSPADPSKFGVKARASISTTEGGAASYRQDVSVNLPIIDDKLAMRATVGYQDQGGWIDTPVQGNANRGDLWSLRLRVDANPTDRLSANVSLWRTRNQFSGPSTGQTSTTSSSPFRQPIDSDFDTVSGKISYDFGPASLTSATSYLEYHNYSSIDFSPFFAGTQLTTRINVDVFAEEISLNSNGTGPWRWSIGGIYREAKEDLLQTIPEFAFGLNNINRSKSYAAYAEVTRTFAEDTFEITAGGRYFHDKNNQTNESPLSTPPIVAPEDTASAVTPRLVLAWRPARAFTIYASYSEGFRSGFPQAAAASVIPPAQPDRLKNYEIGAKGNLFGGMLALDTAFYYIDWQDVQQNITVSSGGIPYAATVNGSAAQGFGFEAAATLRPAAGLTLDAGFSLNDLTQDENIFSGGVLLFAKGSRLNYSPKYNANIGASYSFDIGSGNLTGRLSASAYYTSRQQSRVLLGTVVTVGDSDSAFVPEASFSLESRHGWTATVFGQNLSNFHGVASPGFGGLTEYYGRLRPRTIGFQLEFKY